MSPFMLKGIILSSARLFWAAFGKNPLQSSTMHRKPTRRFRNIALTHLINPLNMFPAHPIRRHRIFRRFWHCSALGKQRLHDIIRHLRVSTDNPLRRF